MSRGVGDAIVAGLDPRGDVPCDLLLGFVVRCWRRWGARYVEDDRGRVWRVGGRDGVTLKAPDRVVVVEGVAGGWRYPAVRPVLPAVGVSLVSELSPAGVAGVAGYTGHLGGISTGVGDGAAVSVPAHIERGRAEARPQHVPNLHTER